MRPPPAVTTFVPDPELDAEIAALCYGAVAGWPDQRPITASLVRSRLRPTGQTPTLLATQRTSQGQLVGAAALRWPTPPTDSAPGRLWGPVVDPDHRRARIGTALLDALSDRIPAGTRIQSAEVPAQRTSAATFYRQAGWNVTGCATLLKRHLPINDPPPLPPRWKIRQLHDGEDLTTAVANLYRIGYPTDPDGASGAFARWTADERFTPSCLSIAEHDDGIGAIALVYPLAHGDPSEPPEALLADVILDPAVDSDRLRPAVMSIALNATATEVLATVARAVTSPQHQASNSFTMLNFRVVDRLRYFEYAQEASEYRQKGVTTPHQLVQNG